MHQKYSSDVKVNKISDNEYKVNVTAVKGPFKNLINIWHLREQNLDGQKLTLVEFFIDFEFQSIILEKMIGIIFEKATAKMIDAFEKRATDLYQNN